MGKKAFKEVEEGQKKLNKAICLGLLMNQGEVSVLFVMSQRAGTHNTHNVLPLCPKTPTFVHIRYRTFHFCRPSCSSCPRSPDGTGTLRCPGHSPRASGHSCSARGSLRPTSPARTRTGRCARCSQTRDSCRRCDTPRPSGPVGTCSDRCAGRILNPPSRRRSTGTAWSRCSSTSPRRSCSCRGRGGSGRASCTCRCTGTAAPSGWLCRCTRRLAGRRCRADGTDTPCGSSEPRSLEDKLGEEGRKGGGKIAPCWTTGGGCPRRLLWNTGGRFYVTSTSNSQILLNLQQFL